MAEITNQGFFGFHQVDKAKKYLEEKGILDKVISTSNFGGEDFEIVIAANCEKESKKE